MKRNGRQRLDSARKRITERLAEAIEGRDPLGDEPEFSAKSIQYEMSDRAHAISCGGIGAMHLVVQAVGLITAINGRLSILERRRSYSEADHILNIAYNVLCGGYVLNDCKINIGCVTGTRSAKMRDSAAKSLTGRGDSDDENASRFGAAVKIAAGTVLR